MRPNSSKPHWSIKVNSLHRSQKKDDIASYLACFVLNSSKYSFLWFYTLAQVLLVLKYLF